MTLVDNDVHSLLKNAGWKSTRQVRTEAVEYSLRSTGFQVSDFAMRFLSQLAFSKLDHEPSISFGGQKNYFCTQFDPTVVATPRDARVAERCAATCGKALCPIGTDGFHLTIYVSGDGEFFAGADTSVFRYADSVGGLFRAMRDGVRPSKIGGW
jgi:SUKH-3 immunity protein